MTGGKVGETPCSSKKKRRKKNIHPTAAGRYRETWGEKREGFSGIATPPKSGMAVPIQDEGTKI